MSIRYNFYNTCGKFLTYANDSVREKTIYYGANMVEALAPPCEDASKEAHIPIILIDGNYITIQVGQEDHPMRSEHYIEWIKLITNQGIYTKYLVENTKPQASFTLQNNEKIIKAYAYCKIHGLWPSYLG